MNNYSDKTEWIKHFKNLSMNYPSEYVIRIFKGKYPNLNLSNENFTNKKICDIGCGDGRNIVFLNQCGFETYGTEISKEIVDKTKDNLFKLGVSSQIKVGTNNLMPFENNYFDYLLSWNSCYYMGENYSFESHVEEFNRILKPGGYLILSIPKHSECLFYESKTLEEGYEIIQNDPFKVRNGAVLRMFKNQNEIQNSFSKFFTDFIFASIEDDCFGLNYHWHLVVCKKK